MKVIDSHMHYGKLGNVEFTLDDINNYMVKNDIFYGCVSNIAGCEFEKSNGKYKLNKGKSQLSINEEMIHICRKSKGKLKALIWIKANQENYDVRLEKLINENYKYVAGLKLHPRKSRLKFSYDNYKRVIEMGERVKKSIVIHTEEDEFCTPKNVFQIAKKFINVNFVMVHMGLNTNHFEAMKYVKHQPNLYGDTTLVSAMDTIAAIKICGSKKILYGSDMPCELSKKSEYINNIELIKNNLLREESYDVLFNNAKKIFDF